MEFVKEINPVKEQTINVITRSPEQLLLKGFYFESWELLRKQLKIIDWDQDCVFSDLTLGAWKGHWIINELNSQLNLGAYINVQPLIGIETENQEYADTISRLIDNESIGDQNFIIAYRSCLKIISKLLEKRIKWVVIISPFRSVAWENENIQFIELLYKGLKNTDCQIGILTYQEAALPNHWKIEFDYSKEEYPEYETYFPVPGVIDNKLTQLLNDSIPVSSLKLASFRTIISPYARKKQDINLDFYADSVKKLKGCEHLSAYFEILNPSDSNSIDFLQMEAARRFSEGGYGIALRILEAIRSKTHSILQLASIIGQIQNIRIALMYFTEAASEIIPPEELPNEYKASLYQSKAWGLVMTNKPHEAESYFELARTYLMESTFQRLYLYLLNISALNKLKIGHIDTAFAFEKEIENKLSKLLKMDWHILYINSINQARLYKKIKDYNISESYYLKAFAINQYLKSESDLLYTNLCLAQLEDLRGNYNSAFIFWLRTCIHWLSNEIPESLAPRVAQSILYDHLSSEGADVEKISEKLSHYLQQAKTKISLNIRDKLDDSKIVFSRINHASHAPEIALGTLGLGVFASTETEQAVYHGEQYGALKKLVYAVLCVLLPDIENYKTIYTDTQFSSELPVSSKELLSSCIRHKVSKVIFGTQKYTFAEKERFQLLLSCKIKACSAISSITRKDDTLKIKYKRYRDNIILTKVEKSILESIDDYPMVENIYKKYEDKVLILEVLREMEEKRLITIYL